MREIEKNAVARRGHPLAQAVLLASPDPLAEETEGAPGWQTCLADDATWLRWQRPPYRLSLKPLDARAWFCKLLDQEIKSGGVRSDGAMTYAGTSPSRTVAVIIVARARRAAASQVARLMPIPHAQWPQALRLCDSLSRRAWWRSP